MREPSRRLAPGLVGRRRRAVQDLSRVGLQGHLVGANSAQLLQEMQHQIGSARPGSTPRPGGRVAATATRFAASISSRTELRALSTSAAISTTRKAALKAATTRFKWVRSLIASMVSGRDAGPLGPPRARRPPSHENHESSFMMPLIRRRLRREEHGAVPQLGAFAMKWETPQAVELRFGMEITMYVANR